MPGESTLLARQCVAARTRWIEQTKHMNNAIWPSRLYALDASRAFASLSVVLFHWRHFAYRRYSLPQDFVPEHQPLYGILKLFYDYGTLGVEYFFVLSGFIFFWLYRDSIEQRKMTLWRFFVQRFSRLYPLHLITLLAVATLQAVHDHRESLYFIYPYNDSYHFLLNLGFASSWGFEEGASFNAPIWSVSIEILLYFLFFLVAFFRLGHWLFSLLISIAAFTCWSVPPSSPYFQIYHLVIFKGIAYFFLGGAVYHLTLFASTRSRTLKQLVLLISIILWLGVIIDTYFIDLSSIILTTGLAGRIFLIGFPGYILFPATVCGLSLLEIAKGGRFFQRIAWFGNITYSSYLLHFPLQLMFGLAVSYGVLKSGFYMDPKYLALYFALLIPLSRITYVNFERPAQSTIRNRLLHS